MMPAEAGHLGVEIMNAARRWVQKRGLLRRALDSKSATPKQIETHKKNYERACHELEVVVARLERLLAISGKAVPMAIKATAKPDFPWQSLFSMIAAGAKAAEHAVTAPLKDPHVIDVEATTVDPSDKR